MVLRQNPPRKTTIINTPEGRISQSSPTQAGKEAGKQILESGGLETIGRTKTVITETGERIQVPTGTQVVFTQAQKVPIRDERGRIIDYVEVPSKRVGTIDAESQGDAGGVVKRDAQGRITGLKLLTTSMLGQQLGFEASDRILVSQRVNARPSTITRENRQGTPLSDAEFLKQDRARKIRRSDLLREQLATQSLSENRKEELENEIRNLQGSSIIVSASSNRGGLRLAGSQNFVLDPNRSVREQTNFINDEGLVVELERQFEQEKRNRAEGLIGLQSQLKSLNPETRRATDRVEVRASPSMIPSIIGGESVIRETPSEKKDFIKKARLVLKSKELISKREKLLAELNPLTNQFNLEVAEAEKDGITEEEFNILNPKLTTLQKKEKDILDIDNQLSQIKGETNNARTGFFTNILIGAGSLIQKQTGLEENPIIPLLAGERFVSEKLQKFTKVEREAQLKGIAEIGEQIKEAEKVKDKSRLKKAGILALKGQRLVSEFVAGVEEAVVLNPLEYVIGFGTAKGTGKILGYGFEVSTKSQKINKILANPIVKKSLKVVGVGATTSFVGLETTRLALAETGEERREVAGKIGGDIIFFEGLTAPTKQTKLAFARIGQEEQLARLGKKVTPKDLKEVEKISKKIDELTPKINELRPDVTRINNNINARGDNAILEKGDFRKLVTFENLVKQQERLGETLRVLKQKGKLKEKTIEKLRKSIILQRIQTNKDIFPDVALAGFEETLRANVRPEFVKPISRLAKEGETFGGFSSKLRRIRSLQENIDIDIGVRDNIKKVDILEEEIGVIVGKIKKRKLVRSKEALGFEGEKLVDVKPIERLEEFPFKEKPVKTPDKFKVITASEQVARAQAGVLDLRKGGKDIRDVLLTQEALQKGAVKQQGGFIEDFLVRKKIKKAGNLLKDIKAESIEKGYPDIAKLIKEEGQVIPKLIERPVRIRERVSLKEQPSLIRPAQLNFKPSFLSVSIIKSSPISRISKIPSSRLRPSRLPKPSQISPLIPSEIPSDFSSLLNPSLIPSEVPSIVPSITPSIIPSEIPPFSRLPSPRKLPRVPLGSLDLETSLTVIRGGKRKFKDIGSFTALTFGLTSKKKNKALAGLLDIRPVTKKQKELFRNIGLNI